MKYFVCSDIHGFYNEFIDSLEKSEFNINDDNHKLIICGDIFDRGNGTVHVYNYLKLLKSKDKLIYIKGNHEDLLFECVNQLKETGGSAETYHYSNGTIDTVKQLKENQILGEALDFIENNAIDYYETNKYIFVHGWIPTDICGFYYPDWRNSSKELWNKSRWVNPVDMVNKKIFEPNKTIVCGHWHCSALWHNKYPNIFDEFGIKENFEPFIDEQIIALDACTVHTRKVNLVVLDD